MFARQHTFVVAKGTPIYSLDYMYVRSLAQSCLHQVLTLSLVSLVKNSCSIHWAYWATSHYWEYAINIVHSLSKAHQVMIHVECIIKLQEYLGSSIQLLLTAILLRLCMLFLRSTSVSFQTTCMSSRKQLCWRCTTWHLCSHHLYGGTCHWG